MEPTTNILLLEVETTDNKLLAASLQDCGYDVSSTQDRQFDPNKLRREPPAAILVDIRHPVAEVQQKLNCIRGLCQAPAIGMITADMALETANDAYTVDHFIFKPFQIRQLQALIKICQHGSRAAPPSSVQWPFVERRNCDRRLRPVVGTDAPTLRANPKVSINLDARDVYIDGNPLGLSPKEFSLFELLASRTGGVVSEDEIMNTLWPRCSGVADAEIRQYVYRLRRKIDRSPAASDYIQTVKGRGYRLVAQSADPKQAPDASGALCA
jgi:DNA-binding response OmpR family regulator